MGLRGPAPKPNAVRIHEGTYREDRHGGGMAPPDGLPIKPTWLGEIASAVWDERIDELSRVDGLLSPVHGPALALYCHQWQVFHEARQAIEHGGPIAEGGNGGAYQHPWVSIQNRAAEMILKLGAKFGMSPVDFDNLKERKSVLSTEFAAVVAG